MLDLQTLKNLPITFGIYQYFDTQGKLLYIGKAKNIKKRVKSYFKIQSDRLIPNPNTSQRIQIMISQVHHINTVVVPSEQDALLLENSMIKQLKPKYNILLRDDKTYPYIAINLQSDFPFFEITRKIHHHKKLSYFGPYPSGARDILDSLYDLLPLVQKKSCMQSKKACLFYQIQKCPAPCEKKITKEAYASTVQKAIFLLQHKESLLELLQQKMHYLAKHLMFEEAQIYKNRLQKISQLSSFSEISCSKPYYFDILGLATQKYQGQYLAILVKIFMRDGKMIASDFKRIKSDYEIDEQEVFKQYLLNHYKNKLPLFPEAILLSHKIEEIRDIEQFIQKIQDKKILLQTPKQGFKKNLITIALKNAQELLRQETNLSHQDILVLLKESFNLSQTPFRIEVFDTSHHGFSFNVGGMVVYESNIFDKESYRHYHLTAIDEYAQMRELLTRRIESFDKNPPPNLWILDGGKAQLNLAKKLLDSAGYLIDLIAISKEKIDQKAHRAKGRAKDIIYTLDSVYRLETTNKKLQFFQKLRDEAHRFAISFHRKQKTKNLTKKLPYTLAQQKRLLQYFGDFSALQKASQEEIKQVLKNKPSR